MKQIIPSIKSRAKMIILYVYAIWFSLNVFALTYGIIHPHRSIVRFGPETEVNNIPFYPFESTELGTYNGSEFVMYTIVLPIVAFSLYRICKLVTNHSK